MWVLIANRLLNIYTKHDPNIWAYADDFMILTTGNTRVELEENTNKNLLVFNNIVKNLDLNLSSDKSMSLIFGKYNLSRRKPAFKIDGKKIAVKTHHKYLGVILDDKLSWHNHVNYLKEKVMLFTSQVHKVRGVHWGTPRQILKIWYETVAYKQLEYACEVWYEDINMTNKHKLQSLQRTLLNSFMKGYRTTSLASLQVLAGTPPIDLLLHSTAKKYRITKQQKNIDISGITYFAQDLETTPRKYQTDTTKTTDNLKIIFKNYNPNLEDNNQIKIYTDGSKMDNKTAYAFVVYKGLTKIFQHSERILDSNTVFQAELYAIFKAIEWTSQNQPTTPLILTDSQASILTLEKLFPTSPIHKQIQSALRNIPSQKIHLAWVRGHINNQGNEEADKLAKIATTYYTYSQEVKTPLSLIKHKLKREIVQKWQDSWDQLSISRHAQALMPKVSRTLRAEETFITYFVTGHGSFPTYLFRIGKAPNDRCYCGERGTPTHYIFNTCSLVPHSLRYNRSITTAQNFKLILQNKHLLRKLGDNYNTLNEHYSFIYYKF